MNRRDALSPAYPRLGNERGSVLGLMVLLLVVFLGLAALVIDLGIMFVARSEAQRAADAAAHAGAGYLLRAPADEEGARDEAIRAAGENLVRGSLVDVDRDLDIDVLLDEAKVRVRVHRTEGRGNPVGTLFAGVIGFHEVDVGAVAAAEVYPASNAKCVLPIALADRWCKNGDGTNCLEYSELDDRWESEPNEHYVPWIQNPEADPDDWVYNEEYTGYGTDDRGELMVLRSGTGGGGGGGGRGGGSGGGNSFGITPWFSTYVYEDEPPGGPAQMIADRVLNCHDRVTRLQEGLWAGPGFMTPVVSAFEDLIALDPNAVWNPSANDELGCVTTAGSMQCRDSPRIRPIVLFDPREGPDGPAGSSDPFPVANLAGVFVEDAQDTPASSSYVTARFIEYMGETPGPSGGLKGSLSRVLRIVE